MKCIFRKITRVIKRDLEDKTIEEYPDRYGEDCMAFTIDKNRDGYCDQLETMKNKEE